MLTFGQTVWLWRVHRKMTQAQLAKAARLSQPNLSAVEKGQREVTLGTLRALGLALGAAPGELAEGRPPQKHHEAKEISRKAIEAIARAAVDGRKLRDRDAAEAAEELRVLIEPRLNALGRRKAARVRRSPAAAWLRLSARYPRAVIESLVERAVEHSARP
jgi:transcriptional regulator with XRE-family HTH domain